MPESVPVAYKFISVVFLIGGGIYLTLFYGRTAAAFDAFAARHPSLRGFLYTGKLATPFWRFWSLIAGIAALWVGITDAVQLGHELLRR